jgi:hypothetical protein
MLAQVIVGEEVNERVDMPSEAFVQAVVTRKAEWRGRPVELVAWGLSPAPFLILKELKHHET